MKLASVMVTISVWACAGQAPMSIRYLWAPAAPPDSVSAELADDIKARFIEAFTRKTISIDSTPVWASE